MKDAALAVIPPVSINEISRLHVLRELRSNTYRPSSVQSDQEAVELWLQVKTGNSRHTNESYRRESQKLLLWLKEQGLTLATLTLEHVHAYYAHLENPPPHWIRPRKPNRDADLLATQVMASGANAIGLGRTRMLMANLFGYLQDLNWVRYNPFKLSMKPPTIQRTTVTRVLDVSTWHVLRDWVREQTELAPEDAFAYRQRWVLMLLYHAGLRREEVANGRMGDFLRSDHGWKLRVLGKGNKERFVSIDSVLLDELTVYRAHLKLSPLPSPLDETPLIAPIGKRAPNRRMTARSINNIVGAVVEQAAGECHDVHVAASLASISPHYFRHTNATHRLKAGASLKSVQSELGHSSIATTGVYLHVDDQELAANAELLAQFDRAASS